MPKVRANSNYDVSTYEEIEHYIKGFLWSIPNINKSKWPNRGCKGVERFQRTNFFGNEDGFRFPFANAWKNELLESFLKKLASDYLKYKTDKDKIGSIITTIAWTYQGKSQDYFNNIIKEILYDVEKGKTNAQKLTLCINLLESDENLIRVFRACLNKLAYSFANVSNWMRCLYQILMYNEFICSQKISLRECAKMMNSLCYCYSFNKDKPVVSDYILRSILFLLKRRKVDPLFCRKESEDGLYQRIVGLDTSGKNKESHNNIIKFLDGEGTLKGIPIDKDAD